MKQLQRAIVTSATYRQSSHAPPALLERDPENRLLARGSRQRLSAEMIRDAALAASGLLVERIGGPSVKPYQPARLWLELTGNLDYVQHHGDDLYRRSIYTFVKRTVAPPTMVTFDSSPRRNVHRAATVRTNTPLQARADERRDVRRGRPLWPNGRSRKRPPSRASASPARFAWCSAGHRPPRSWKRCCEIGPGNDRTSPPMRRPPPRSSPRASHREKPTATRGSWPLTRPWPA